MHTRPLSGLSKKDRCSGISHPLTRKPRKNKFWTSPKWRQVTTEVEAPTEEEVKAEATEVEEEDQVEDPNPEEADKAPEVGDPEAEERVEISDEKHARVNC